MLGSKFCDSTRMVSVLVRHDYGIQRFDRKPDGTRTLCDGPRAEPSVDENRGVSKTYTNGVTATPRSKTPNLH